MIVDNDEKNRSIRRESIERKEKYNRKFGNNPKVIKMRRNQGKEICDEMINEFDGPEINGVLNRIKREKSK